MYVHYFTRVFGYFLAFYVTEYDQIWASGVWLVLVRVGPSCPHALSRLILSLSSAGWTAYGRLHFLPTGAVWLGYPFGRLAAHLGAWLGILVPHMHTCCHNVNYHTYSSISGMYIYIFKHIDHITGEDRTDFALSNPSVGNNYTGQLHQLSERLHHFRRSYTN